MRHVAKCQTVPLILPNHSQQLTLPEFSSFQQLLLLHLTNDRSFACPLTLPELSPTVYLSQNQ